MAEARRRVVAVLGYSRGRSARLHPVCAARVASAESLAHGADAVVLSGWSRHRSVEAEAELMRAAWRGPEVRLLCDGEAGSTADNARNVATLAAALGTEELVAVTSWWHRPRTLVLLRAALRGRGIAVSVVSVPGPRLPVLHLLRELGALALLPLQLRRARADA